MSAINNFSTYHATSSFIRPGDTNAYSIGDLVANSTTAGSVVPMSFVLPANTFLRRARLIISGTSSTNASFNLYIYGASPVTITNGDNGAWSTSGALNDLGYFAITCSDVFTDGCTGIGTPSAGNEITLANTNANSTGPIVIYALLVAEAAYTPTSAEVFTVKLECYTNAV